MNKEDIVREFNKETYLRVGVLPEYASTCRSKKVEYHQANKDICEFWLSKIPAIAIEKTWKDPSGDITVRASDNCGIVEIVKWNNNNRSCYVIGYWDEKAELKSVQDRLPNGTYSSTESLLDILRFGQKLADLILEINDNRSNS